MYLDAGMLHLRHHSLIAWQGVGAPLSGLIRSTRDSTTAD
jgi:hypothetical protein